MEKMVDGHYMWHDGCFPFITEWKKKMFLSLSKMNKNVLLWTILALIGKLHFNRCRKLSGKESDIWIFFFPIPGGIHFCAVTKSMYSTGWITTWFILPDNIINMCYLNEEMLKVIFKISTWWSKNRRMWIILGKREDSYHILHPYTS